MGDTKDEEKENGKVEQMQELLIPSYVLTQGTSPDHEIPETPKYPLLVFVNSKSGGQLGGAMLNSFRDLLNPKQVRVLRYFVAVCVWEGLGTQLYFQ